MNVTGRRCSWCQVRLRVWQPNQCRVCADHVRATRGHHMGSAPCPRGWWRHGPRDGFPWQPPTRVAMTPPMAVTAHAALRRAGDLAAQRPDGVDLVGHAHQIWRHQ